MPAYVYPDGFPFWPNPSPQQMSILLGRQKDLMLQDLNVNQEFRGRADEIGMKQKPVPVQARAEGYQAGDLKDVGKFGTNLYDQFMKPYTPKDKGTP
jgi:hypothetical protein